MKDIHNHILFGIDDGSNSLKESINIIKKAVENGYTDLIITPHYRSTQNYTCNNRQKQKIFNNIKQEVEEEKIQVNLYLGNEITLDDDFFYYLRTNQITSLNNSRYMLLELPFFEKLEGLEELFDELKKLKLVPIIAHPERYEKYRNLEELEKWISKGILFQGNISSLYGKYGTEAKNFIEEMLKRHMIHFMGSDIHHDDQSSYDRINKTIERLTELTGSKEMAMDLVDGNIEKVIKDEKINTYSIRKKKHRLKLFRSLSR